MVATLILGPNQSGKSFALWRRLRSEAPGQAWLVRPQPGLPRELVRQAYAWGGAGLLPPVVGWGELLERLAVASGETRRLLSTAQAAHLLRPWLATRLRGTRREALAGFRATAREVAELVLRLDDHRVADQDLALAGRPPAPAWLKGSCDFLAEARAWLAQAAGRHGLITAGARAMAIICCVAVLNCPKGRRTSMFRLNRRRIACASSCIARQSSRPKRRVSRPRQMFSVTDCFGTRLIS